jgi:ADP-ribosylation factor-like protein 13B
LGLNNSGKTKIGTVLCKLPPEFEEYAPTQGSRFFEMKNHKKHCVKITELGGSPDMRKIWKYYYLETFGVIYVIDASADAETMAESRMVFSELIANEYIAGKPMLVLANKSDIYGAADSIGWSIFRNFKRTNSYTQLSLFIDICEYFAIEHFANMHRTPIMLQETGNHLADDGLENGFSWLIQTIENNSKSLRNRVSFHRKFADDEFPKRILTGRKRKKVSKLISRSCRDHQALKQYQNFRKPLMKLSIDPTPLLTVVAIMSRNKSKPYRPLVTRPSKLNHKYK